ncbi:Helix-turn-helix domain-containing protein [Seinonella peptonophila]|uniref:Helix-turn-helix domain-containing protein n=1 Tax=Seinonella peptonophila TaxID=112248 RepID=A0A1M4TAX1_9BACL|nr:helix-turn-helix domain-containing protein [Seinonella peptonophila]SHE41672.1 Helix-turn-helix domain-containing protein [Seinonella peptonophila]
MIGIGRVLLQARLKHGFSLDEMHRKTNIQVSYLKALEEEDFRKLPSPFYARGFLRAYARSLRLNPQQLLEQYEIHVMKRQPKRMDTSNKHGVTVKHKKTSLLRRPKLKQKPAFPAEEMNQLPPRRVVFAAKKQKQKKSHTSLYWIGGLVLLVILFMGLWYFKYFGLFL